MKDCKICLNSRVVPQFTSIRNVPGVYKLKKMITCPYCNNDLNKAKLK